MDGMRFTINSDELGGVNIASLAMMNRRVSNFTPFYAVLPSAAHFGTHSADVRWYIVREEDVYMRPNGI
jgi:hypothetical protein